MTPSYSGDSNDWKMARLQMIVDMSLGSTAIRPSSICDSHEHNSKTHQDKVERHFNQKLASGEPLDSSQLPKGREHAQSTLTNRGTSQQVRSTLIRQEAENIRRHSGHSRDPRAESNSKHRKAPGICTELSDSVTSTHLIREQSVKAARGPAEAREGPDNIRPVSDAIIAGPACHVGRNRIQQLSRVVQQSSACPCNC